MVAVLPSQEHGALGPVRVTLTVGFASRWSLSIYAMLTYDYVTETFLTNVKYLNQFDRWQFGPLLHARTLALQAHPFL